MLTTKFHVYIYIYVIDSQLKVLLKSLVPPPKNQHIPYSPSVQGKEAWVGVAPCEGPEATDLVEPGAA